MSNSNYHTNLDGDIQWSHKWGFADTYFTINPDKSVTMAGHRYPLAGYPMPFLLPFIEELLEIKIDPEERLEAIENPEISPPSRNPDFCQTLTQIFPSHQYSFDDKERLRHSHGQTTFEEIYPVLYGIIDRVVDMVFYCESAEDAQTLIKLAITHNVCLVPFGGGTSVSCALKLPAQESRMIVSVDMQRMNQVEWIDRQNLRACVQAGITGKQLEAKLQEAGFMCGHEPDSLELSTLGGWIATNASGMKKNRYGNIEEIVENITLLTPSGVMTQIHPIARASMGMQVQKLLFGNEGNLGLITSAIIRIHPLPESTHYGSLIFPTFELGTQFLYDLAHHKELPASIRLVDNHQFRFGQALKPKPEGFQAILQQLKKFYVLKVRGFNPHKMVAVTLVMEGAIEDIKYQSAQLYKMAKQFKGIATGAENGKRGYGLTYAIAYLRDFLAAHYVLGETFETTVPWSKIHHICHCVKKQLQEQHKAFNLPGRPYLSYRISQVYHTGVCIYFMFGMSIKGIERPDNICSQIEKALRQTIITNGGSISHHHGVGKLRHSFMKDTLSPASIEVLKHFKQTSDPHNIFGIRNNVFMSDDDPNHKSQTP